MGDGGKGDKRRKGADDAKYRSGWENIWGKRDNSNTQGNSDRGRTEQDSTNRDSQGNVSETGR